MSCDSNRGSPDDHEETCSGYHSQDSFVDVLDILDTASNKYSVNRAANWESRLQKWFLQVYPRQRMKPGHQAIGDIRPSGCTTTLPSPSCSPRAHAALLPPCGPSPRKTLVLDLDKTLIDCLTLKDKATSEPDFVYKDSMGGQAKVWQRPFLKEFLQGIRSDFEVVLFTAAGQRHADAVLDVIDPDKQLFDYRLYGQHTVTAREWSWVKDLSRLGRDLSKTLIVDDCEHAALFQPQNWIPIKPFDQGEPWAKQDMALMEILKFLKEKVLPSEDVRTAITKYYNKDARRPRRRPSAPSSPQLTLCACPCHSHAPTMSSSAPAATGNAIADVCSFCGCKCEAASASSTIDSLVNAPRGLRRVPARGDLCRDAAGSLDQLLYGGAAMCHLSRAMTEPVRGHLVEHMEALDVQKSQPTLYIGAPVMAQHLGVHVSEGISSEDVAIKREAQLSTELPTPAGASCHQDPTVSFDRSVFAITEEPSQEGTDGVWYLGPAKVPSSPKANTFKSSSPFAFPGTSTPTSPLSSRAVSTSAEDSSESCSLGSTDCTTSSDLDASSVALSGSSATLSSEGSGTPSSPRTSDSHDLVWVGEAVGGHVDAAPDVIFVPVRDCNQASALAPSTPTPEAVKRLPPYALAPLPPLPSPGLLAAAAAMPKRKGRAPGMSHGMARPFWFGNSSSLPTAPAPAVLTCPPAAASNLLTIGQGHVTTAAVAATAAIALPACSTTVQV